MLKDGSSPIYVRLTVNRKRTEFSLQRSIDKSQWHSEKGYAIGNTKEAKQLNATLDHVRIKIMMIRKEMEESGMLITSKTIRNRYIGNDDSGKTILGVFSDHNKKCEGLIGKDFAPGTVMRYQTCYLHTQEFIKEKYRKEDLPLHEITPMFVSDFEYYLKTKRVCCHNTATKYLKNFKKITRIAMANGWLKSDPFVHVKFHLDEVDMDYLSENELNTLMNKQFTIPRLQTVKDLYLFCCFTGLAFVDAKSLTAEDIEKKGDSLWIKKRRQKTKNWCTLPLLQPAEQILEKYQEHPQCIKTGYLLPIPSNQKMNAYLKEIADLAGIEKNLSTHTARHTFATTVTLSNHVSLEVVSKMLGHSNINMTKKYARVVDDLICRDMQKLHGKYNAVNMGGPS